MDEIKVILVDWMGYPFFRKKRIGENTIFCGIEHILHNIPKHPAGIAFEMILVINGLAKDPTGLRSFLRRRHYKKLLKKYPYIKKLFFRNNTGQDIGAYNFAFNYLKKVGYDQDVLFMNSAIDGPHHDGWLLHYNRLFHARKDIGLCGINMHSHNSKLKNNPFMPHIQSYFLYTNMQILMKVFKGNLCGADISNNRTQLISEGEIGISQKILDNGYAICCMAFENFFYRKGGVWDIPFGEYRFKKEFGRFANQI